MDLTKPKKKSTNDDELTNHLESLIEKALKGFENKVLKHINDKFKEKIDYSCKEVLKKIGHKIDKFFDKYEKQMLHEFKKSNKSIQHFCKRIDTIEETFLIIYQNIKQNQFLYANYPEEWIKEVNEKMKKALNE